MEEPSCEKDSCEMEESSSENVGLEVLCEFLLTSSTGHFYTTAILSTSLSIEFACSITCLSTLPSGSELSRLKSIRPNYLIIRITRYIQVEVVPTKDKRDKSQTFFK